MRPLDQRTIQLGEKRIDFRLARSSRATKLRIRVDASGVEVFQPSDCEDEAVDAFLVANEDWLLSQVDRISHITSVINRSLENGDLLFRGVVTRVGVERVSTPPRSNRIQHADGSLLVQVGSASPVSPVRTLESWLRRQARNEIEPRLRMVAETLGVSPGRLYIMDQRTKWGNCSSLGNLSFSWRIIMAPDWVLDYLVAHEVAHLAVPNHSKEFWLTLQSICPQVDRARSWLSENVTRMKVDLASLIEGGDLSPAPT